MKKILLFACDGSFHAVALRGGTREEFQSLLDTVGVSDDSSAAAA